MNIFHIYIKWQKSLVTNHQKANQEEETNQNKAKERDSVGTKFQTPQKPSSVQKTLSNPNEIKKK